jgi:hypothetical protein
MAKAVLLLTMCGSVATIVTSLGLGELTGTERSSAQQEYNRHLAGLELSKQLMQPTPMDHKPELGDGAEGSSIYYQLYDGAGCEEKGDPQFAFFYIEGSYVGPTNVCVQNVDDDDFGARMYQCDESNLYITNYMDAGCTNYSNTMVAQDYFTDYVKCYDNYGTSYSLSYSYNLVTYTLTCSQAEDVYSEAGVVWHQKFYDYSYSFSGDFLNVDPTYACTDYDLEGDMGYYNNPVTCNSFSYGYLGYDFCVDGQNISFNVYDSNSNGCSGVPVQSEVVTGGCIGNSVLECA